MGLKSATASLLHFIKFFMQMEVRRCLLGLHPFESQSELLSGSGFWVHLRPSNVLIWHGWTGASLLFFLHVNGTSSCGMSHLIVPFHFHFSFLFFFYEICNPLMQFPQIKCIWRLYKLRIFCLLADSSCLCYFCKICFVNFSNICFSVLYFNFIFWHNVLFWF